MLVAQGSSDGYFGKTVRARLSPVRVEGVVLRYPLVFGDRDPSEHGLCLVEPVGQQGLCAIEINRVKGDRVLELLGGIRLSFCHQRTLTAVLMAMERYAAVEWR